MTRRAGQRVMIGDDVVVEVVSVRGGAVRLQITAPPAVLVDREEVRRSKRAAAGEQGA